MQRIKKHVPTVRNVCILLIVFAFGAVLFSPSDQPSALSKLITDPSDSASLQTVVLGPLEFQFDNKKRSSLLLVVLAILLYSPNLVALLVSKVQGRPSQGSQGGLLQNTEVSSTTTVKLDQQFNFPQLEQNLGAEADFFNEGVRVGSRYGFQVVAHQMIAKIRTEARALGAGFTEEEHATRYRSSKLTRLTEFCSSIEAACEEQWFLQACEQYQESVSEKHVALKQSLQGLDAIRKELFLLIGKYEREAKKKNIPKTIAMKYEEQFKGIYERLIDELRTLCDALSALNARCAAEFSQLAATDAMCDFRLKLAARKNS
ncbi:hypothetical protein SH449x_000199 [Pirellulaceae bacterium SH449]